MTRPHGVQRLWNYCNVVQDDGLLFRLRQGLDGQHGGHVEKFTFLFADGWS